MRRTLGEAKRRAALSYDELWVRYFGLGGTATVDELRSYLGDEGVLERQEVNALAQALNEHFLDLGMGMPVRYLEP